MTRWNSVDIFLRATQINTGHTWYVTALFFSTRGESTLAKECCLRSVAMGNGKAAIYFAAAIRRNHIRGSPADALAVLEMVSPSDPAFAESLLVLADYYESGYGCRKSFLRCCIADIIRCTL